MQSELWARLLRSVPAEQHNQLVIMTSSRTEIAVQALLRIEEEFLAIKGRLAGSQDSGRVFFIPFVNIDYLGIQKDVKESEFDTMFGVGSLCHDPAAHSIPVSPAVSSAPQPPSAPSSVADIPLSASVSHKTPLPLKSEVLERFRSRIAGASSSHAGTNLRPTDG